MSSNIRNTYPPFAESQRAEILDMLRAADPNAVSKAEPIFEKRRSQCGARVFELEKLGSQITHVQREGERYVRFVLESEPLGLQPSPEPDWYTRQTGKPRSIDTASELPLFSGGNRWCRNCPG
jgi:hypothetical protein